MGHVITSVESMRVIPDPYTFAIYDDAVEKCNQLMQTSSHPYGFVVMDNEEHKVVYIPPRT